MAAGVDKFADALRPSVCRSLSDVNIAKKTLATTAPPAAATTYFHLASIGPGFGDGGRGGGVSIGSPGAALHFSQPSRPLAGF